MCPDERLHDLVDVVLTHRATPEVAVVTLNRPDRMNAISPAVVPFVIDALTELNRDLSCRVVVLTGAGRAFCAGIDIKDAVDRYHVTEPTVSARMAMQELMVSMVTRIRSLRQPVIGAVNGPAVGIGMALALACDVRVASPSAQFMVGAVRLGITAGEAGISYHLPKTVGTTRAFEIMLTGRTVEASEAERIGLVARIVDDVDLVESAVTTGQQIAVNTPYAVEHTKQLMWANLDASSLDGALMLENHAQILGAVSGEFSDALAAVLGRRHQPTKNE